MDTRSFEHERQKRKESKWCQKFREFAPIGQANERSDSDEPEVLEVRARSNVPLATAPVPAPKATSEVVRLPTAEETTWVDSLPSDTPPLLQPLQQKPLPTNTFPE